MLVDHADPAGDRICRTGELDDLPIEQDLTLVGPREAVENVHQGGLAGAVLPEQGMDLAGTDIEVDPGVGDDARIPLGDPTHLERGRADDLCHHRRIMVDDESLRSRHEKRAGHGWPTRS